MPETTATLDWIALQKQAHREFGERLHAIVDWDAPTPDEGWSVRDLVRHVIAEQQWVPHLLDGSSIAAAKLAIDPLREDLVTEWQLYSFAATTAWEAADAKRAVHLSYGTVSVEDYLREQVSDVTIHSWDLARAIGASESLNDDLVAAVWTVFEPQQDTLAASGLFAPPVAISEDAPLQWRLLAVTGRDPRATAG